jgi:hypothetical protein
MTIQMTTLMAISQMTTQMTPDVNKNPDDNTMSTQVSFFYIALSMSCHLDVVIWDVVIWDIVIWDVVIWYVVIWDVVIWDVVIWDVVIWDVVIWDVVIWDVVIWVVI